MDPPTRESIIRPIKPTGIDRRTAQVLVAELATDMSVFPAAVGRPRLISVFFSNLVSTAPFVGLGGLDPSLSSPRHAGCNKHFRRRDLESPLEIGMSLFPLSVETELLPAFQERNDDG